MSESVPADDAYLVARCLDGDAGAWTALVQRYQPLVYAIARRARLDDHTSADIFQAVFARLMQHLPRIEQPGRLQAWIVTTAKREALRTLRTGRRTVSMSGEGENDGLAQDALDVADDSPLAEQALSDLQQLHQLRGAVGQLDGRCRALIELLFRDEDDTVGYDEIARRFDMPLGSVGPTRARCLGKLRRLFEGP